MNLKPKARELYTGAAICALIVIAVFGIRVVEAQNVQHQENTVDKAFRSDLKVDPVTLGMSLNIPLDGLTGRGGTSLPIGLSYSSKLWKMEYGGYVQNGPCCEPRFDAQIQGLPHDDYYSWLMVKYADDSGAGWRSNSLFPEVVLGSGNEKYDLDGDPRGEDVIVPYQTYTIYRFRLRMPDGSTREFRKDDKPYLHPWTNSPYPVTYYSTDSSKLRYVQESDTNSTLFLPDGSRYVWGSQKYYIDRNGNKLVYSANNQWTDTLGRVVNLPGPQNRTEAADETYTLPGLGTSTRSYILRWRPLRNEQTSETVLSNPIHALHYLADANPVGPYPLPNITPTLFESGGGSRVTGAGIFNPIVLAEIELPDGEKYKFRYNVFGEIDKIIYPTGSYERFEYAEVENIDPVTDPYGQTNRGVIKRWMSENGTGSDEVLTQYSATNEASYITRVTNPDGSYVDRVIQKGKGPGGIDFGFDDARAGGIVEERVYSATGQMLRRSLNSYVMEGPRGAGADPTATRDARLEKSISIIMEPSSSNALMTMTANEYDLHSNPDYFAYLNVKRAKEYGFVNVSKAIAQDTTNSFGTFAAYFNTQIPAKISETDYLYDEDYKARGIIGLPGETRVLNPANPTDILAKTQTVYDNTLPSPSQSYQYSLHTYGTGNSMDCSPDPQNPKICWENPNGSSGTIDLSYRALPTTTRTWVKETDTWLQTDVQYDQFGNAIKAKDLVGNETTTEFSADYKYAYPTKATTPAPDPTNTTGTNQTSMVETTYDFSTGLPVTVKDDFGQITRTQYDSMLRPWRVFGENFTAPESQTIYGQADANGQLDASQRFVRARKQIDANNWDEAITWFDGLGRTVKTQAKDSQGDVFVETKYDNMGRPFLVTNPYRAGETVWWNKTKYDAAGRAFKTFAPASYADATAPNETNLVSLGTTAFDISTAPGYVGTVVTTTDASQRKGRSITNALGQLIRVDEPHKDTGQLGEYDAPIQPTSYKYDAYGKMVHVQQGDQNRYFKYDSLGRLLRVRQPEQEINQSLDMADPFNTEGDWTAGFTYDVLGNVLTATDANGVTITNTYDRAGRVKTRTYSGEPAGQQTPAVSFYYDGKGLAQQQTPNYAKGKLTKVDNGISSTEYMTFDNFGRLTRSKQITDGVEYGGGTDPNFWMTYTYNLSGALVEERYPSGRVVNNAYESDGDLARIYGKVTTTSTERTYAASFSYTPDGRISRLKLGNGLWEAAKFNDRLQVTELAVGHGVISGDVWKLGYEYGDIDGSGSPDTSKNTGNVTRQTLSFGGLAHPFVQTYKYDSLCRLTEAKETSNGNQTWRQVFDYDRYGNRISHQKFNGTEQVILDTITQPHINPADNRIDSPGYDFDKNGNLITDGEGRHFAFNADNKQREVRDENNNLVGEYFYDGEGKRVKKVSYGQTTETTVFVYSSGKLVAEYSTETPPAQPTTNFTVTDLLGSPRVLLNSLGEVVSRRDFLPFGEEIAPDQNVNFRTAAQKYVPDDGVRQKFTGYQKDKETGLDFAEARMYENRHARFTAVDPLLASGKSADPQTFNRYVYVMNNPLIFTDPEGLQAGTTMWFRTRGDGGRSFAVTRGAKPDDGRRWERWNRTENVRSSDGTVQRVSSSGFTGVGVWDRNAVIPSQGISSSVTPSSPDTTIGDMLDGFSQAAYDAPTGMAIGAENFGKSALNSLTNPLGPVGAAAGVPNPLALDPTPYENARQFSYGTATEFGLTAGTITAGGAVSGGGSSLSVVPEITQSAAPAVHGNSLNSLRPTWGYRLFQNDGTFLKNGITSQPVAEARYTKAFMSDKNIAERFLFPNRREARIWEIEQNTVNPGPLNIRR